MICRSRGLGIALLMGTVAIGALAQEDDARLYRGDLGAPEDGYGASSPAPETMAMIVGSDRSVVGRVFAPGSGATSAEIREGGAGGVLVSPLLSAGDGTFLVPPGTRLTAAQYEAYLAGYLFVVVHGGGNDVTAPILRPAPTLETRVADPLQPRLSPSAPMTAPMGITTPMSGRGRK